MKSSKMYEIEDNSTTYIKKSMKLLLLLCHIVFATENGNYLSILDQLDMSNPMIIGELGYLRSQKMFHLMKNVMISDI